MKKIDTRHSLKDAGWWGLQAGFGESYLQPLFVLLNANTFQLGLLGSLPHIINSIFQLIAVHLTQLFKKRKTLVVSMIIMQAITWLIFIILLLNNSGVWIFLMGVAIFYTFGALSGPGWFSWMGDIVESKDRGVFFGKRNRLAGMVSFICIILGGVILETFTSKGFIILFSLAFIGRLMSGIHQFLQEEPKGMIKKGHDLTLKSFLKKMMKNDFGIFTVLTTLISFAIFLSAPLITFYWIKTLNFSISDISFLIGIATISAFITTVYWGKASDKYGNKAIIEVCGIGLAIIPFLWFFNGFIPSLLIALLIQTYSGMINAGFGLASSNFIYDLVNPELRYKMVAYHNSIKGVAILIGGVIGGIIANVGILLLISGILTFIIIIIFIPKINEVRKVKKRPHYIHFITWMPVQGIATETVLGLNRTLKRFKR